MNSIYTAIKKYGNPKRAQQCQRFFKTGPGQYAQGDIFLGITNPQARLIAKQFKGINLNQVQQLVQSKFHEQRFIGLLILLQKFKIKTQRKTVYDLYMSNLKYVNNWDLVDSSAPGIVGAYLINSNESREILYKLCKSQVLWQKRISIISTLTFIRANDYEDSLKISQLLLSDKHDLIHKAVGWMLREVGSRNVELLQKFIKNNYNRMARTTLRYSIQKFEQQKRKRYLKGQF